ncbi:MAG: SDR family oxidoreductase [Desulfuromonadaceae bacterium]|nr:SDR family oxidoreductase [Desulfuromonadaceae bacterium]MDD5105497.1 SDR family oxidoreductase [Desulfuromonadaceae bacterium]
MQKVFVAGCGYIGERIATSLREVGAVVTCMVRSPEKAARLESDGYTAMIASLDDPTAFHQFDVADAILYYLVPPPGGGTADTRARNFIAQIAGTKKPARIIYMSATSVYSEAGGAMITEESPALPDSAMGKRRLDAETAFRGYGIATGVPVIILRVSGIYGPGRLPLMQISQGQPLLNEHESGPSNRIHADDLVTVCLAVAEKGEGGDIFNVSDGTPTSMTSYFNACADALGLPRQPQVTMEEACQVMSPLMLSYISQTRIICNRRMGQQLGVQLRYPTVADGLAASVPLR